jgi:biopolymer transport protein ExbB
MSGKLRRFAQVAVLAICLGWAVGGLASRGGVAWAQGAEGSEVVRTRTVWDNIVAGGITEALIILLSVVGLALIIEHAVSIRREKLIPPYILSELESLLDEEEFEEAMDVCDREDAMFCRIAGAGLSKVGSGYGAMREAVEEVSDEEATTLHQKISYLSLIASVAPMLGLLGTVIGMIESFNTIAAMRGMANASDLADGISKALVTTCTGLIVAIPVLSAYMFFRNRVLKLTQEATAISNELIDRFRRTEQQ